MKLKSKQTGEIMEFDAVLVVKDIKGNEVAHLEYDSIQKLTDQWEDYEELKGSALDLIILTLTYFIENEPDEDMVDLEDCKQMLEKLKAWQRLKDKGFRFKGYTDDSGDLFSCQVIRCSFDYSGNYTESRKDIELLFGGEE